MKVNYLRPGEFRICPRCSARQKGLQEKCGFCGASLAGAAIAERIYSPVTAPATPGLSRGLRAVIVFTVVGAAALGVALRNTFKSAAVDQAVVASESEGVRANARTEAFQPDASIYERFATPPPANDVPEGWYGLARTVPPTRPPVPSVAPETSVPTMATVSAAAAPIVEGTYTTDPAAVGGMVGIAPRASGLGRKALSGMTLTNDDLDRIRSKGEAPAPTPSPDPQIN